MRNFVSAGDQPDAVYPYDVASGGGVLIGPGLFGVALANTKAGSLSPVLIEGVVDLAKAAGPVLAGGKLYWDDVARAITTAANGNTYVGAAVQPAAAGDPTVRMILGVLTA